MTQLVQFARAMADPTRIRMLSALRDGELCVCELCDALGIAQSTLSTHLQSIRAAGLVRTRRQGKWVYYALHPDRVALIGSVFGIFAASMEGDRNLRRDAVKLSARLEERREGACCVGFCRPKRRARR